MNKQFFLALLAAILVPVFPVVAQIRGYRQIELKQWEFSKDSTAWQEVTIPHSWNAVDGHSSKYYRGKAYYRCYFRVNDIAKPRFLLFEGAAQSAVVTVNGIRMGAHRGGYTAFPVAITEALKRGINVVEVICDNREDVDLIPVTSDFNKNGGLHNPVWLIEMEDVYLSPKTYGMYRLRCETPLVTPKKVQTLVKFKIVNDGNRDDEIKVRVQLLTADGVLGYQADREVEVRAFSDYDFSHEFLLSGVHLWDGVKDPYLYTLRVELFRGKRMVDIAETKIGYRSMEMDPERGFLLNGRPYPLRGVNMHQDMDGKASALTLSDYRRDYAIVKELGANFLRLAHYPHNDFAFCLCDSLGLIVQTEIPWVNVCGVDARQIYFNNIHEQMREMISNLYNHPSIGFWGMWNELDSWGNQPGSLQGELDAARVVSETAKLYAYAKQLDPGRFVGLTDCSDFQRDGYTALKADYYSENRYHGWYYDVDNFEKFSEAMERIHKQMGVTNVGEYGVGINPFCHYWDRSRVKRDLEDDTIHSEEYGNLFHESYVSQIQRMPWLNFTAVWVLFDFPVANREEGWMDSDNGEVFVPNEARKYMNDKGLVTRDRMTRKDPFYLYKSLWNTDETTVYITGRRLRYYPVGQDLIIKVYSNAKSLTLYQNGKQVARKTSSGESTGVIWEFPAVRLKTDQDTFKVVSDKGVTDSVTLSRLR
jgi:beta-galactosidase/beta-glucuronidase